MLIVSDKIPQNNQENLIDKSAPIVYNSAVKKNIDRAAILTDIADHRRGMQHVLGSSLADRLGISVL